MSEVLSSLLSALGSGAVEVVDLTQPLSESTPIIHLPEPFTNTPGLKVHDISNYDDAGPAWKWRWLEIGEHVGTHVDAPVHWITGRDLDDLATMPAANLVGPAIVFDRVVATEADPDYVLTVADLEAWQAEHGPFPERSWLFLRTGWDSRAHDEKAFLNASSGQPRTPGFDAECSRVIAQETPIVGVGVETVGIDAGGAGAFDPPFPLHNFLLGANKYGLTQVANLRRLPATGAVVIVAPMKLVGGTGSPARALALVPRE